MYCDIFRCVFVSSMYLFASWLDQSSCDSSEVFKCYNVTSILNFESCIGLICIYMLPGCTNRVPTSVIHILIYLGEYL